MLYDFTLKWSMDVLLHHINDDGYNTFYFRLMSDRFTVLFDVVNSVTDILIIVEYLILSLAMISKLEMENRDYSKF